MIALMEIIVTGLALFLALTCSAALIAEKIKRSRGVVTPGEHRTTRAADHGGASD